MYNGHFNTCIFLQVKVLSSYHLSVFYLYSLAYSSLLDFIFLMTDAIQKAVDKLKTLETIKIKKTKTSNYNYDTNAVQDRLDIEFNIKAFTIECVIIYSFY